MAEISLTPRWTPLNPHTQQAALWNSKARFVLVPTARRAGKSELAKRRIVMNLWEQLINPTVKGYRCFAGAPVRKQAKDIFWDDLIALIPKPWIKEVNKTDLSISTIWDASVHVVGLEAIERIEGIIWDFAVIDEFADLRNPQAWESNIRPALSTAGRPGSAWLLGVPSKNSPSQLVYEDLVNKAKMDTTGEYACFHWPSADILPPEEIESARRSLDPSMFRQEYLGEFILSGGRAFPDFDISSHVKPATYDPYLPICWSLDFNIQDGKPQSSLICQIHKDEIRVIDEMLINGVQTSVVCEAFLDRSKSNNWNLDNLAIYGDATGNSRDSTSGTSDWTIILNAMKNIKGMKLKVPRANPQIKDTINAVNGRVKSADGKTHIIIDQRCTQIIKDLRAALWPGDLEPFHCLSALRYFVHYEFPITNEVKHSGFIGFSRGK